jgi:hypothetical protein
LDVWLPFVYQYAVMTVVFAGGLALAGRRRGPDDVRTPALRRGLVAGYLFFIALHAFLQFAGPALGGHGG